MSVDFKSVIRQLKQSAGPIHETVAKAVSDEINSGRWPDGAKLPSDKAMAAELGINHITLAKALNELRRLGILERRRAHGTFVSGSVRQNKREPAGSRCV